MNGLIVEEISAREARRLSEEKHYLHRAPQVTKAFGLFDELGVVGVCVFGTPAAHSAQKGACPSDPKAVIELNRLWVCGSQERNTESWFVSRALKGIGSRIVISYADITQGHHGYVYRALNFHYAGWTDMERKTPRYDYVVPGKHSRDAFRGGSPSYTHRIKREPKVRYWIATGDRRQRKELEKMCAWPSFDWKKLPPPPIPEEASWWRDGA